MVEEEAEEEEAAAGEAAEKAVAEEADTIDPTEKARNARDTDPIATRSKEMVHATTLPTPTNVRHIEQIWRLS